MIPREERARLRARLAEADLRGLAVSDPAECARRNRAAENARIHLLLAAGPLLDAVDELDPEPLDPRITAPRTGGGIALLSMPDTVAEGLLLVPLVETDPLRGWAGYADACEEVGRLARVRHGLKTAATPDPSYRGPPPADLTARVLVLLDEVQARLRAAKERRDLLSREIGP